MTIRRHHYDIHDGEEVWYYEDAENNPHVYFGIRGNPENPPEADVPVDAPAEP